ncbi:MAG: hypothetical protein RBT41_08400 [Clostridia bacterium]|nr:hypothetical protein [Clostridia bacterium]
MKKLCKTFLRERKGVMLAALLLCLPLFWLLLGMTLDAANARYAASKTKTALNRGVKAAVLALDETALAEGRTRLAPLQSRENFEEVFYLNLGLLPDNPPGERSPILAVPEVLDFYICQGPGFPYVYHSTVGVSHTFHDPGVLAVVCVKHQYIFTGGEQEIYAYAVAEVQD